jgi:alpha-galactosidase
VRDIVQLGDQYRHEHPFDSDTSSINYVSKDKTRCLVLAYQIAEIKKPVAFAAPVSGLEPECMYRLTEINPPEGDENPRVAPGAKTSRSGKAWMKLRVLLQFTR